MSNQFSAAHAVASGTATARTGPSGLLLGTSSSGPVTVRFFRPEPTRVLVSVPEYVTWILAYRAASVGAHVTVLTNRTKAWTALQSAIGASGGTMEVTSVVSEVPGQGRAYRPSLVIDDDVDIDGARMRLGPWQAVLVLDQVAARDGVANLRACDLTIVSPYTPPAIENLRRGYALNPEQIRLLGGLSGSDVVLAMPRRVNKVAMPPTPTEYELLFSEPNAPSS